MIVGAGQIPELAGNEDMMFWKGKRGYHAIFHSKNACGQNQSDVESCGSMAYSADSYRWTLNDAPVYTGGIEWQSAGGGPPRKDVLLSRQRPKLLFAEVRAHTLLGREVVTTLSAGAQDGVTPEFLFNGVLAADSVGGKQFTAAVPFVAARAQPADAQAAPSRLAGSDQRLPRGWELAPEQDNVYGGARAGADSGDIHFLGSFTSWGACVGALNSANASNFNSITWYAPPAGTTRHDPKSQFDGDCFGVRGTGWRPRVRRGVRSARGPGAAAGPCADEMDCELNGKCADGACDCYPGWTGDT